ncbi:hypothetical protein [Roseobacter sp.]|uniref:hypothetical protein n=1 Tax=Roseobacter sp. TaxID=1907202 RepID=UPI00385A9CD4
MDPHPDFVEVTLPRDFALGAYRLAPLSPEFVDEDFDAVMASEHLLTGIFGDWPDGLTREDNLIDLAWHEREFTARRSFSWIIRDQTGAYAGCFYVFPALGSRGSAKAALWLCDISNRVSVARALREDLSDWLVETFPSGIDIAWTTRPKLD